MISAVPGFRQSKVKCTSTKIFRKYYPRFTLMPSCAGNNWFLTVCSSLVISTNRFFQLSHSKRNPLQFPPCVANVELSVGRVRVRKHLLLFGNLDNYVNLTWPVPFGRYTKSRLSVLLGVNARRSNIYHTGGKCVTYYELFSYFLIRYSRSVHEAAQSILRHFQVIYELPAQPTPHIYHTTDC